MFSGHVSNLGELAWIYPAPIARALARLRDEDFAAMKPGRYELEGSDMILQVLDLQTRPYMENRPEVHRRYVDVQFLVSGAEIIRVVTDTGQNRVVENLLAERDILFYEDAANETQLLMQPGSFAVFFPHDVHRPNCAVDQPGPIRKVVIKVAMSLNNGCASSAGGLPR
ncbi:YhcH/YjgK/YiaL family protein [Silvimonas terrae]|uniref:YhcH/YjgK/YiaL family protein n=1 Tax=Silvimonas terrae TaxID=300266 RepID=A0A840RN17_9NEIS|nr:YhcH/YjgK/YiaL family protein [Silvimonas terrae]MBB5193563.1 YhcH/YjgK/YiaL family protein [Silvimonas terrae]